MLEAAYRLEFLDHNAFQVVGDGRAVDETACELLGEEGHKRVLLLNVLEHDHHVVKTALPLTFFEFLTTLLENLVRISCQKLRPDRSAVVFLRELVLVHKLTASPVQRLLKAVVRIKCRANQAVILVESSEKAVHILAWVILDAVSNSSDTLFTVVPNNGLHALLHWVDAAFDPAQCPVQTLEIVNPEVSHQIAKLAKQDVLGARH
mmetsp:Transcript_12021/g.33880  ORF Transcript_12021/g.33880 Transcript_12021/m.33880 type:complete len:206 (-) Transcript_12021:952-1569(-)